MHWIPAFAGMTLCCFSFLFAGPEDDRLTAATLRRVAAISKKEPDLERFGKSTLAESAILLDLGPQAVPGLIRCLLERKRDWKMRFWAADMLGYVGDERAVKTLRRLARSSRERKEVRERAKFSLKEVGRRLTASRQPPSRPGQ